MAMETKTKEAPVANLLNTWSVRSELGEAMAKPFTERIERAKTKAEKLAKDLEAARAEQRLADLQAREAIKLARGVDLSAALKVQPYDAALRSCLAGMLTTRQGDWDRKTGKYPKVPIEGLTPWAEMVKNGGTDEQIARNLSAGFGTAYEPVKAASHRLGAGEFWRGTDTCGGQKLASGKRLVEEARRVLGIPHPPKKATEPIAPKTAKIVNKKVNAPKPAAAVAPAAKPAKAAPTPKKKPDGHMTDAEYAKAKAKVLDPAPAAAKPKKAEASAQAASVPGDWIRAARKAMKRANLDPTLVTDGFPWAGWHDGGYRPAEAVKLWAESKKEKGAADPATPTAAEPEPAKPAKAAKPKKVMAAAETEPAVAAAPAEDDRLEGMPGPVADRVRQWGEPIEPWGELAGCTIDRVCRSDDLYHFMLKRASGYKWHLTFFADGKGMGSGEGWKINGQVRRTWKGPWAPVAPPNARETRVIDATKPPAGPDGEYLSVYEPFDLGLNTGDIRAAYDGSWEQMIGAPVLSAVIRVGAIDHVVVDNGNWSRGRKYRLRPLYEDRQHATDAARRSDPLLGRAVTLYGSKWYVGPLEKSIDVNEPPYGEQSKPPADAEPADPDAGTADTGLVAKVDAVPAPDPIDGVTRGHKFLREELADAYAGTVDDVRDGRVSKWVVIGEREYVVSGMNNLRTSQVTRFHLHPMLPQDMADPEKSEGIEARKRKANGRPMEWDWLFVTLPNGAVAVLGPKADELIVETPGPKGGAR